MASTEQAWGEFHGRLRKFVAGRVGNPADAEDIVQQVFLRMHRALGSVKDSERLGPWLYQTARNAIADHYRAPARRRERASGDTRELDERAAPPGPQAADERDGSSCAAECLRPMIRRLPEPYRGAIEKVELDGVSQVRAAELARLSVSGMKARVQRGRARLRSMLLESCRVTLDGRRGVKDCAPKGGGCAV